MPRLKRDVVLWSGPLGTRALPIAEDEEEDRQIAEEEVLSSEPQSVKFIGAYPAGTAVDDIVDIGERNRVRCTIGGIRVTTEKWALEDEQAAASDVCTQP